MENSGNKSEPTNSYVAADANKNSGKSSIPTDKNNALSLTLDPELMSFIEQNKILTEPTSLDPSLDREVGKSSESPEDLIQAAKESLEQRQKDLLGEVEPTCMECMHRKLTKSDQNSTTIKQMRPLRAIEVPTMCLLN